ncbi:uncharacterized protein [Leptinotarsa decemlineata]|uniref:uncharacterized protein n=1 Tax=Leptinotarsa decemlineata TaxID=7539 RepID=UPI003D305E79
MISMCRVVIMMTLCVYTSEATWLSDMTSPKGWQFGEGMVFHLQDTKVKNNSLLDRIAIRFDFGNVGVSATQKPENEAIELDFYVKEREEGRSKKLGNMMIPYLLGAVKAGVMTMALGTLKILAIKSLVLAKAALIMTLLILGLKFLKQEQEPAKYVEVSPPGTYEFYPSQDYGGYGDADSYSANMNSYVPYSGYPLSAAGSTLNYATIEVPGNDTLPLLQVLPGTKRHDQNWRKVTPSILTIRRYSKPDAGVI